MSVQSPTWTPARKFLVALLTPKLSICCYVFEYFVLTDFFFFKKKKKLTLTENLLNFNGTYMGRKQPFESFLKNGCAELLVFWGSMRFYQFEFYLRWIFDVILLTVVTTTGTFRGKYQNPY